MPSSTFEKGSDTSLFAVELSRTPAEAETRGLPDRD